jgi:hypothetical protein
MVFDKDVLTFELFDVVSRVPADDVAVLDEELHGTARILRSWQPTRQRNSSNTYFIPLDRTGRSPYNWSGGMAPVARSTQI